jgi:uncharacterized membrane protein YtjA (UPF0391 family)
MLRLSVVSLLLALITAVLGVTGLLGAFAWLAKFIFVGLLLLFIVTAAISAVMSKMHD